MSIQLILYPQYYDGLNPLSGLSTQFLVDGIDFGTINDSSSSQSLAGTLPQDYISANTFTVNTWYRFSGSAAEATETVSNLNVNPGTGVLQRLANLNVGGTYELTFDIASNIGGFTFYQYAGNILTSQSTITGTGTQTIQFTAASTTDTLVIYTSGLLTVNSLSVQQLSQSPTQVLNTLGNGQVICDLYENEDIPLTLSVDDFKNVAEKVQSYSKAFQLPATKRNNKIFDNIFEITRSDNGLVFNPYIKTKCELKQNGFILFEGYLKLIDISDKEGEISYNVNLYSQAVALADVLKDRTFSNLSFTELEHNYNKTNIKYSWNDAGATGITYLNPSTSGFRDANATLKYPFVDWQHDILISNGANGTSGYPELSSLEQVFRPFINIKYLIDRIFQSTPFTFTSEFFDTPEFQKLYMDFNWGSAEIPIQTAVTTYNGYWCSNFFGVVFPSVNAGTTFTNLDLYEVTLFGNAGLPPNFNDGTNIITATVDGEQYDITGGYEIENTSSSVSQLVTCQWIKNTAVVTTETFTIPANGSFTWLFSFTQSLASGDTLQAQFKRDDASSPATVRQKEVTNVFTAGVVFNVNITQSTTSTLLQTLRGDIGQWDFLKGLMTMFNLISIPDKNNPNNILIEPYADVFINNTNCSSTTGGVTLACRSIAHDWTDKIDVKDIKLSPLTDLNKKTIFKFVEDEDDYTFKVYKNSTPSPSNEIGHLYGSQFYDASEFTILEGEKEIIAEPFAATVPKPLFSQFNDFVVPAIFTSNDEQTEFQGFDNSPRILYNNGIKTLQGGVTYYIPTQNGVTGSVAEPNFLQFSHLTDIPTLTPLAGGGSTSQDYHFGACQYFNGIGSPPNENLFNLYWLPYYNELYNPDTRTMTIKVNLGAGDIATFNMYDTVFIKNRQFRVNKIDYKPNDLATVEFILIP